ncbi:hypothetical protein ASZ90_007767 [hydrocarbon metagenome]|uniref:Uncharacterized protein n=1 Tax=hydrocarbon metagenome TaxID=938273 RepID=A0A0W8FP17_9ZZZZ
MSFLLALWESFIPIKTYTKIAAVSEIRSFAKPFSIFKT